MRDSASAVATSSTPWAMAFLLIKWTISSTYPASSSSTTLYVTTEMNEGNIDLDVIRRQPPQMEQRTHGLDEVLESHLAADCLHAIDQLAGVVHSYDHLPFELQY
ncbi:MAG TPA: hypothetical protein VEC06_18090 [Paucimonas sp.]|nr:hypothetical protein [Paucimonas sp.]